jgi:hypothetical protein
MVSSHVPDCLTRKINIGLLALFDAVWVSGTIVGFVYFRKLNGSTDIDYPTGLALTSTVFGLLETLVLMVVVVFCGLARREKWKDLREVRSMS